MRPPPPNVRLSNRPPRSVVGPSRQAETSHARRLSLAAAHDALRSSKIRSVDGYPAAKIHRPLQAMSGSPSCSALLSLAQPIVAEAAEPSGRGEHPSRRRGGGRSAKTTRRHARLAQRVFPQLAGGGRVAAGLGIAALVVGCRLPRTSEQGRPGGGRYSPDREMGSGLATCGLGRRGRARRGGSWVVEQPTALGVLGYCGQTAGR